MVMGRGSTARECVVDCRLSLCDCQSGTWAQAEQRELLYFFVFLTSVIFLAPVAALFKQVRLAGHLFIMGSVVSLPAGVVGMIAGCRIIEHADRLQADAPSEAESPLREYHLALSGSLIGTGAVFATIALFALPASLLLGGLFLSVGVAQLGLGLSFSTRPFLFVYEDRLVINSLPLSTKVTSIPFNKVTSVEQEPSRLVLTYKSGRDRKTLRLSEVFLGSDNFYGLTRRLARVGLLAAPAA
ncbi:hypothetical protein [Alkalilimnicola ehrlichii]|uniref:hypothetical protein n=1 Tax=Alkalilimnicola ehrlichii TaxID=351052 RepID=UPI0011C076EB|nr:hypothetical protein [Alkalilimnicola ehrlichii]